MVRCTAVIYTGTPTIRYTYSGIYNTARVYLQALRDLYCGFVAVASELEGRRGVGGVGGGVGESVIVDHGGGVGGI